MNLSKPCVIALCGQIGAGKDSVASILRDKYGYAVHGFSDPVYKAALAIDPWILTGEGDEITPPGENVMRLSEIVEKLGWDAAKRRYPEIRRLLRVIGTEAGRDIHGADCWLNIMSKKYREASLNGSWPAYFAIRDTRFPNEADWADVRGFVVEVTNSRLAPETTEHSSEKQNIRSWAEYTIKNDGSFEDLEIEVDKMMQYLGSLA